MKYLSGASLFVLVFIVQAKSRNYNANTKQLVETSVITQCPDDIVINNHGKRFEWKYSWNEGVQYFPSTKPACWDSNSKNIAVRKCNTDFGTWSTIDANCTILHNHFCPEDMIEIPLRKTRFRYLCIQLSDNPHKWKEATCYGSDISVPFKIDPETLKTLNVYLNKKNITKFWWPVTRAKANTKYNPFVWRLPGKYWGDILHMEDEFNMEEYDESWNKNCVVADIRRGRLRLNMTECTHEYHSLCIYKEYFTANSGCPQNFKALSYRPNECYGINWQKELFPYDLKPVTMNEYFKKHISLQKILSAIDMDSKIFFLLGEIVQHGIRYNVEMNANEEFRIRALNISKPALSTEVVKSNKIVKMTLKIDHKLDGLILTVYNRNYLWHVGDERESFGIKCFTNADYDIWKTVKITLVWENYRQTKSMFKLKLEEEGPGYYWCEAHSIFNFALVKSPKVVASLQYKGHPFAVFFDIKCSDNNCFHPHTKFRKLAKQIKKTLSDSKDDKKNRFIFENLLVHNVRIMEIESIDIELSFMRVLCHIIVSWRSFSNDSSVEVASEEVYTNIHDFGNSQDTDIKGRLKDLLIKLIAKNQPALSTFVNSTEFCFPEIFNMNNGEKNQWLLATYSQNSATQKLCLQLNGLPATRKCEGDFLHGAYWEHLSVKRNVLCITDTIEQIITKNLYELDTSKLYKKSPTKVVDNLKVLLEKNINKLIPADFYYMGRILQRISAYSISSNPYFTLRNSSIPYEVAEVDNTIGLTSGIVKIFNYLMKINGSIIYPSIKLNSTNVLLDAFESVIDKTSLLLHIEPIETSLSTLSTITMAADHTMKVHEIEIEDADKNVDTINYEDVGVVVKITTKFLICVINPNVANISGIAIFNADEFSTESQSEGLLRGAFENEFYRFILANQSVDDLLYEQGLQLATYVPEKLWHRLDEISSVSNRSSHVENTRIVIKVYSNDVLFQEDRTVSNKKVFGKIISVSLPGHDNDLPEMLPIVWRTNEDFDDNNTGQGCGYWNYKTWVNDGLVFLGRSELDKNLIACGSTHLTPFAYLIGGHIHLSADSEVVIITKLHERALDIITLIGSSLSLFGITSIFITALAFQTWRQKASSKIILHLCAAIALQMILFCFINTTENSHNLIENQKLSSCIALGASLHYSVLVQFCWMAVIAYLQFKRYVQVLGSGRPKRFFIKSSLFGWGLPILPVLLVLWLDRDSYIPSYNTAVSTICYPSGYSFYFGILLPIVFVIVVNLIIFLIIIHNILRGPDGTIRHTDKILLMSQIRLTVLLFFLLGFTWFFGILTILKAGILFSYLFCITATMQGFVLFIYFIVLDPITRRLWRGYLNRIFYFNNDLEMSTSIKETSQTH